MNELVLKIAAHRNQVALAKAKARYLHRRLVLDKKSPRRAQRKRPDDKVSRVVCVTVLTEMKGFVVGVVSQLGIPKHATIKMSMK